MAPSHSLHNTPSQSILNDMPQVYDVNHHHDDKQHSSSHTKPSRNKRLVLLFYGVIGLSLINLILRTWLGGVFNSDVESEQTLSDKLTTIYSIKKRSLALRDNSRESLASVLVLVSAKGPTSWGGGRSGRSFLSLVSSFDYPKHKLSVGMLTSDKDEYLTLKRDVRDSFGSLGFACVTVMHSEKSSKESGEEVARRYRKKASVQRERRRAIARYRNLLLFSTLEAWHDGVLWLDSDIVQVPPHLLRKMVDCEYPCFVWSC